VAEQGRELTINSGIQPFQGKVTQAQYDDIVLQQLEELWGNYGPLAEIWFDGGTYHGFCHCTWIPPCKTASSSSCREEAALTYHGFCHVKLHPVRRVGRRLHSLPSLAGAFINSDTLRLQVRVGGGGRWSRWWAQTMHFVILTLNPATPMLQALG
jgi:hypothetical protein